MDMFDKDGFYFAPYATLKAFVLKETGVEPTFEETIKIANGIARQPKFKRFYDIAMSMVDRFQGNTNLALMFYHLNRFFQHGSITYKIRKEKVEFLQNIELNIPARMLVLPFDEFLISIPKDAITTSQGSLLNVYVAQEEFDDKIYLDNKYEVSKNISDLIKNNPGKIKRIIRCYSISYKGGDKDGVTSYYQFPVIEDEDVWQQFLALINSENYNNKDTTKQIFNLMLNLCAYLSCPDPEVEKVLGIIRKPTKVNSKKWRLAEKSNTINGYDYFDVGRIYASRYTNYEWMFDPEGVNEEPGRRYITRFKVRRHIRAQWYGARQEDKPGTEQKLILIEEHWKGDDVKDAFKPRMVEVS